VTERFPSLPLEFDLPAQSVRIHASARGQTRRRHGREEHHVLGGLELLRGDATAVFASNTLTRLFSFLLGQTYADQPSTEHATSASFAVNDLHGALFHAAPREAATPVERVDDAIVVVQRQRSAVEPYEDVGPLIDDVQDARGVRVSTIHDRQLSLHPPEALQRFASLCIRDVNLADPQVA
jgi:hypothetical protein